MVDSPGWHALRSVIDSEVQTVDRSLGATHKALEHADYALLHGRRTGLRSIYDATEAILSRATAAQQQLDDENAAEPATV